MIKKLFIIKVVIGIIILIANTQGTIANETELQIPTNSTQISQNKEKIQTERRNHVRFNNNVIKTAIDFKSDNNISLIDISRGGVALEHNNSLTTGDIISVVIKYKDLEINTSVEIINSDEKRAGAKFIPQDKTVLNDLLYLSIQLEFDNGLLVTRLKEG